MRRSTLTAIIILTTAFLLATFVILYPKKIPYSLDAVGKILPHKEWIVERGDNLLTATLHNHTLGTIEDYFVTEFERRDAIRFTLNSSLMNNRYISKGDTIGSLDSSEITLQLINLQGELRTLNALLKMSETGEKESVINEAIKELEFEKARLAEQEKQVLRIKNLYETKFVPFQEYEIAQSDLEQYKLSIERREAQLKTVQTGVKPEEIDYIKAQIFSLEEEIEIFSEREKNYKITAPISGMMLDTPSNDVILDIVDTSTYTAIIPVKFKNKNFIMTDQDVNFTIEGIDQILTGNIYNVGSIVRIINGEQMIAIFAVIDNNEVTLLPGTMANCSIVLEPITLLQYFFRTINTVFNR